MLAKLNNLVKRYRYRSRPDQANLPTRDVSNASEVTAMVTDYVETLIVGGGQAGLTMSDMLSQRGLPHLVLERGRIAERWRSERWDGLRFQFPNWSVQLPDYPLPHADPGGFATSGEIVNYLEAYARQTGARVRCGVTVTALRNDGRESGYVAETSAGPIRALNVVIATGPYQKPVVPDLSAAQTDLFQVHASAYKHPDMLPPGSVLVVGSGASGAQIAEELVRSGRKVYLSVGRHKRMPRRYRGHDVIWWLATMGLDQTPVAERGPDATLPLITGAYGGHTVDFREFAAQEMILVGRLQSMNDGVFYFADDLAESLAFGDAAYAGFLDKVDYYIEEQGMDLPPEPLARAKHPDPVCLAEPLRELDKNFIGLGSLIWATGYTFDFSWIDLPVLDAKGAPVHENGVARLTGIYFLGLPWLSRMSSSFLSGVGDDAARLADIIRSRCDRNPAIDAVSLG
jgi:putative flavoprotein involved in K+ transport